ncbi:MAG TPA: hypothetical protein VFJ97_04940 [Dermatophilaceae bacterium]|nr:hypothetical protein [Dermatophilaceae bacterium]
MSDPTSREGPSEPDVDARFADIVARFHEQPDEQPGDRGQPRGPASPEGPEPQPGQAPTDQVPTWTPAPGEVVFSWRASGTDSATEPEEHFVPPPPAPLPAGDLQFWAILIGLVGGPLLLLWQMVFVRDATSWWLLVAVAMTAGGFGLLVARLPARRDEDDDDNGARV